MGANNLIRGNIKRSVYDSTMLIALTLNNSIEDLRRLKPAKKLEDFTYEDGEMAAVFNDRARNVHFAGISVSRIGKRFQLALFNTSKTGIGFTERKSSVLLSHISEIYFTN